jgi:hypothetical protein
MDEGKLEACSQGFICAICLERGRTGRDATTKAARAMSYSLGQRVVAKQYREWGDMASADIHEGYADEFAGRAAALSEPAEVPTMALGEAVPAQFSRVVDTLKLPGMAALDASAHRLELLGRMGNDCAAMALDAADSISAGNSLEKMLAHQLAVAHKSAMTLAEKGAFQPDAEEKARLLNLACRMMETYQRGLLTLQRLRSRGERNVVVQLVTVADGGQAIIGKLYREK